MGGSAPSPIDGGSSPISPTLQVIGLLIAGDTFSFLGPEILLRTDKVGSE
jgi:hypothetical protein